MQDTRAGTMRRRMSAHTFINNTVSIDSSDGNETRLMCDCKMGYSCRLHGHSAHHKHNSFDGRLDCQASRRWNNATASRDIISHNAFQWTSALRQIPFLVMLAPIVRGGAQRMTLRSSLREATNALIINKRRWKITKRRGRHREHLITHRISLTNAKAEPQRGASITGGSTDQPSTIDQDSNGIRYQGVAMLDLRGGGPHPAAGVLKWLYESEDEDTDQQHRDSGTSRARHGDGVSTPRVSEVNDIRRTSAEVETNEQEQPRLMTERVPPTPPTPPLEGEGSPNTITPRIALRERPEWHWESHEVTTTRRSHGASGARRITGEVNHQHVIICPLCMCDVLGDDLNSHRCQRQTPEEPHHSAETEGQQHDGGTQGLSNIGDPSERYNMYEMDADDQVTMEWAQEPEPRVDGSVCQGCHLPLYTPGVQWRICRC